MSVSEETYAAAKKLAEQHVLIVHGTLDVTDVGVAAMHNDLVTDLLRTILTEEDLRAAGFEPLDKE